MFVNMKHKVFFFLAITTVLLSCKDKKNELLGTWSVNSKFYKAICFITETEERIKGQVLYYNDDTTVYNYEEGTTKNYFFNNIKEQKNEFVDAISGATKTGEQQIKLKLRHKDTLEVTTYIVNKPLTETWIRIE